MTDQRAVKPYAKALFELAKDNRLIDTIDRDLDFVTRTIRESQDLKRFLSHPQVSSTAKKETMTRLVQTSVHPLFLKFLYLVIDRGRENLLAAICDEFNKLAREDQGIVEVHIESALPLNEEQKEMFAERLGQTMGKEVRILAKVDPSLIGGARIQIGDRVLNGSLQRRIEILAERLRGNGGGVALEH